MGNIYLMSLTFPSQGNAEMTEVHRSSHANVIKEKISGYLRLMRVQNCLIAIMASLTGNLIGGGITLLPHLVPFLYCAGGMVLNDYFDYELDRINRPDRPIPSGIVPRESALFFSSALFLIGSIILIFSGGALTVSIGIVAMLMLVVYNWKMKREGGIIGNVMVSSLTAMTFLYGGSLSGSLEMPLLFSAIAFFAMTGREIVKDIEDALGDSAFNVKSLPITRGEEFSRRVASLFMSLAVILALIPVTLSINVVVYSILVSPSLICYAYSVLSLIRGGDVRLISKATKWSVVPAILAFLGGVLV